MDTTFIYFLQDPEKPNRGYVGKTDNPTDRPSQHIKECRKKNFRRATWINALVARGLKPSFTVIAKVPKIAHQFWERSYIRLYRCLGFDLMNGTDGGGGVVNSTPEIRKKQSDALSGEKNPMFGKKGVLCPSFGIKHSLIRRKQKSESQVGIKNHQYGKLGSLNPKFGVAQPPETCAKRRKKLPGSKSLFFGLSWISSDCKWRVRISVFGKRRSVGTFSDEVEAAKAYDIAAKIHHGKFAKLNFPD